MYVLRLCPSHSPFPFPQWTYLWRGAHEKKGAPRKKVCIHERGIGDENQSIQLIVYRRPPKRLYEHSIHRTPTPFLLPSPLCRTPLLCLSGEVVSFSSLLVLPLTRPLPTLAASSEVPFRLRPPVSGTPRRAQHHPPQGPL